MKTTKKWKNSAYFMRIEIRYLYDKVGPFSDFLCPIVQDRTGTHDQARYHRPRTGDHLAVLNTISGLNFRHL